MFKKKQSKNKQITISGGKFNGIVIELSTPEIHGDHEDGTCDLSVSYDIIDAKGHEDLDNNKEFTQLISQMIQSFITGNKEYESPFGKDDIEITDTGRDVRKEGSAVPQD